jgi:hypothetical protein
VRRVLGMEVDIEVDFKATLCKGWTEFIFLRSLCLGGRMG